MDVHATKLRRTAKDVGGNLGNSGKGAGSCFDGGDCGELKWQSMCESAGGPSVRGNHAESMTKVGNTKSHRINDEGWKYFPRRWRIKIRVTC